MQHVLVREGWPHDRHGNPFLRNYGEGHGLCSCGQVSLDPGYIHYRRFWHIAHARRAR